MSWLQVDDRFLDHPKVVRAVRLAGSPAVHLWLGLMAFCKQRLTDGVIPADMVDAVAGPSPRWRPRALDALVTVGLIEREASDYRVHDYLALNESRETIERKASERRAKDDARRAAHLASLREAPKTKTETKTETETETETKTLGVARARKPRAVREPKPVERKWTNVVEAFPDWAPNDMHAKLAAKYGKDLRVEAAKYRDHEFKVAKRNPDRTFNNWLRPRGE